MLSLVVILLISGMIVVGIIGKNKKWSYSKKMSIMTLLGFTLFISAFSLYPISLVIYQNDTGYLQNRVDTLTQVNGQMQEWKKEISEELNNNPELLNYVNEYIDRNIKENNDEIIRCSGLQEDRVPLYRWLLYFG